MTAPASARLAVAVLLLSSAEASAAADGVGPVTQDEVDAFVAADLDGDRRLAPDEFRSFVRAMAETGQSTARLIRFFGAYGFAFSIADADSDGFATPAELREADNKHREEQD